MNKKMENLYAEINALFHWVEDLKAEHKANPDNEKKYSDLLTAIGFRVLEIMEEIDIARMEYQNQPLWKRLLKK